ncbi:ABC transporter permease [Paenibacillus nasutitermitis]|uniref:Aliphatic sulfonates transport permease protein SsuC n=1 Tax=Paenibacillus nasutitermitis TaxID=1652958 RepID=A0A916YSD8_9BACL|nr:ABC transporter permease [Paenibacillus nasutitermitis]GGD58613.1 putative aliphatic sulfonates transport permease protein SsuC [Paenibacillus nasutitermitis]
MSTRDNTLAHVPVQQSTKTPKPVSGASRRAGKRANKSSKTRRLLWGSLVPGAMLLLWQLASWQGWVSDLLFPSPIAITQEFYALVLSGDLYWHLKISLQRALIGFVLGGSTGLVLGLLVGMFRRVEDLLDPTIQMFRTVPLLAITPLFILWFGFGELSKDLLIAMGAFFPLYVNTFLGVRNVDAKLFEVAKVLEFSRYQQVTKLVLPAALPNVLLGLRLSLSVAWLCLVVAELMGSDQGVGYMIQDARSFMRTSVVFVGIAIFASVGKLSDSLVRILEKRLLKWQDSYKG